MGICRSQWLIAGFVLASLLSSGCRDEQGSPRTKPSVVSAELVIADAESISPDTVTILKRAHAERIVSIESCVLTVKWAQTQNCATSWLATLSAEPSPTEAAAKALVAALQATPVAKSPTIRLELADIGSDSIPLLQAVGDSFIRTITDQERSRLQEARQAFQLELDDEVLTQLREIEESLGGDADGLQIAYDKQKLELGKLIYDFTFTCIERDGLARLLNAKEPHADSENRRVASTRIATLTREADAMGSRMEEISRHLGNQSRSPSRVGVLREKASRLRVRIKAIDDRLAAVAMGHSAVRWLRHPAIEP
ncbi:hypothetical protein [Humisphaera borealis]|uniref:Uncharacterized protein n=1 Tax=Humisphaera borealis TaxID=2807512 RepID=A0A7M2WV09_9BACT|nr:hypothetical protein [Humisphaera borealis]QOV89154.1 hypothetical protein IPV69_23530 [Humisphaera borealis]